MSDFNQNNNQYNQPSNNQPYQQGGGAYQQYRPESALESNAKTCFGCGLAAIITCFVVSAVVSTVLAIISLTYAGKCKDNMGNYINSDAKNGRLLSIIALSVSGVRLLISIAFAVLWILGIGAIAMFS